RFFVSSQLDQVGADVVVGVAEVGIDGDRHLALVYRLCVAAKEAQCPAQKRVGLRGRANGDRRSIVRHRLVEASAHLRLVPELEVALRFFGHVVRHHPPVRPVMLPTWERVFGSGTHSTLLAASCPGAPHVRYSDSVMRTWERALSTMLLAV